MARISKEQFDNLRKLGTDAGLDDHEIASILHEKGVSLEDPTYDEEQYKNQHPGVRFMEGAGEMADTLNKVNPMIPAGRAIGGVVDAADKVMDNPLNPGYQRAKKDINFARSGFEGLGQVADSEFQEGRPNLGMLAGMTGLAGELSAPRNPADLAIAGLAPESTAAGGKGQLPLPLKNMAEIRPGIEGLLRKGASEPFDALRAMSAIEKATMEKHTELTGIDAAQGQLGKELTAAKTVLGADLPFGTDLELGERLKSGVETNRKSIKAENVGASRELNKMASKYGGVPDESINTAKKLLSEDVNADILKLPEDAGLKKILNDITKLESTETNSDPLVMGVNETNQTVRQSVGLEKLLKADSDLGKRIAIGVDKSGNFDEKAALLQKLKSSIRKDIDGISSKLSLENPEVAGKIKEVRSRWKNYFAVFDNPTITKVRSADDPAALFDSIKKSEQSMERLKTALGPNAGQYREFKTKFINELVNKMENSDKPVDVLEGVLQEPSGKETLTKFFTDGERQELRGIASGNIKRIEMNEQTLKLEKELDEMANEQRNRRLGDLGSFRGRRGPDRNASSLWDAVGERVKKHGMRYGAGAVGTALFASSHPYLAGISVAVGVAPDLISSAYAKSPAFRVAVNHAVDLPSGAALQALDSAYVEYTSSRKQDEKPER